MVATSTRTAEGNVYHQFLVSRELGGAGSVALHWAKFLTTHGRQSPVWIPGMGRAWDEAKALGLTVRSYDLASASASSPLKALKGNWQVLRGLRRRGPGLVHVHSPGAYGALRRALGRSGLKRVVHVQIEESEPLLRWALKNPPELIIVCARFLVDIVRHALPQWAQAGQKIAAVPNAVDTARFFPGDKAEAKNRLGAAANVPLIVMLANLAPHKGQETLIHAVAILKKRNVSVACWLAGTERGGEGTYTARLCRLVRDLGVGDRVQLLGQRPDAPELLRAADLFVLPSTNEGLPLSILEAQATKVPVLTAPTAGTPEAVNDGQTGFLIAAQDAHAYADKIALLLGKPDLYHSIADQAYRRTIRDYNWDSLCRQMGELYDDLTHGPPTRPTGKVPAGARSILGRDFVWI